MCTKRVNGNTAIKRNALTTCSLTMCGAAEMNVMSGWSLTSDHKYGAALVMEGNHIAGIFTTVDALRVLAQILD